MQELLTVDEMTTPDSRSTSFEVWERSFGASREISLQDRRDQMADLALPDRVPEAVRDYYVLAQNMWLYGWFYWPLYTWSGFHIFAGLEMAFRMWAEREGYFTEQLNTEGGGPMLRNMFEKAIAEDWISDREFDRYRERVEAEEGLRNALERARGEPVPSPLEQDDQRCARTLAESMPRMRNLLAHPTHYWHMGPAQTYPDFELTCDIIVQLFPD